MTTYLAPLIIAGGLIACGVYLLLSRNLTRMLLGLLLASNAASLLILTIGGPSGNPPVRGRTSGQESATADPLAQALILTAIVITMGVASFVLALIYRSYRLTAEDEVANDPEDTRVAELSDTQDRWLNADRPGRVAYPDSNAPDDLDALPHSEGSQ